VDELLRTLELKLARGWTLGKGTVEEEMSGSDEQFATDSHRSQLIYYMTRVYITQRAPGSLAQRLRIVA